MSHAHSTRWSGLEVLRHSPAAYHGLYVTGEREPSPSTPAMRLGTAAHVAILQPHLLDEHVAVAPNVDKRTKAGKKEWSEFVESAGERVVITVGDMAMIDRMAHAVMSHADAGDLLSEGRAEEQIVWGHCTGIEVSSRLDWVVGDTLVDLKTTADVHPKSFASTSYRWGYHRQAALYMRGWRALGHQVSRFVVVAVSKKDPDHPEVATYEFDEEAMDLGYAQTEDSIRELDRRLTENDWTPEHCKGRSVLSLPGYAYTESRWEVGDHE